MLTRLILRLPWFVSAPTLVGGALLLAVGGNLVLGTYFERTFRDDADPFAAVMAPASQIAMSAPAVGAVAQPAGAGAVGVAIAVAPAAVLVSEGTFVDGDPGHNGRGHARLIRGPDGASTLRLENFSVTNGPDLFVILSTDPSGSRGSATAEDAVNLGRLKATDGNINYAVPEGVDVSAHRSVIIYCRAFNVVFAVATLEAR